MSVGAGRTFDSFCLSVCLFVRSITLKQIVQSWCGEWPWDILEVTWFWGWKVTVRITFKVFHTNSWSVTPNRMIPNCPKLVQGMNAGYPRSHMVLGLKGQVGVRVQKYGVGLNSKECHLGNIVSYSIESERYVISFACPFSPYSLIYLTASWGSRATN